MDLCPPELHLARELVEHRGVGRGAKTDRFRFRLRCEPRRLCLRLRLDLRTLRGGFSSGDDRVGLCVCGGLERDAGERSRTIETGKH